MFSVRTVRQVIFVCCLLAAVSHEAEGKKQKNKVAIYQRQRIKSASYLLQLRDDNGQFFCAATLVAPQFVVTAAECFDGRDYNKAVVVAQADTLTDEGVQRKILKVTTDPAYNSDNKNLNVAVLKLDEPFAEDEIKSIPVDEEPLKEKDPVLLWGWRHLVKNDNEFNNLYAVILNVIPQEICDQDFNATAERNHFCVTATGYEGHYPVGDLGGPAVRNKKLSGVALACHNCENDDHTISYIDLHKFQSFIASAMK